MIANYPYALGQSLDTVCFVLKVFSPEGRMILEPRSLETFRVIRTYNSTDRRDEYRFDITKFVKDNGIPIGYTTECAALVFLKSNGTKVERIPIYPGEVREAINYSSGFDAQQTLKHDESAFTELATSYGVALLLSQDKFKNIGHNLLDGLSRYNNSDFGGAVMSFRKSLEAWRDYIIKLDENDFSEKRLDKLRGFTNGATGILSNFGLHAPANAGKDEAQFSRRVAITFTEYVYKLLNTKR